MRMQRSLLAASLALLLAACGTPTPTSNVQQTAAAQAASAAYDYTLDVFHPVIGHRGMVASEQALASQIGLDILKSGGNAIDAAVGMGFALAVTLPNAGNLGGGGFMVVHDAASGQDITLDFREMAPSGASRNMYLDEQGNVVDGKSLYTHYAVGVPGTPVGLEYALQKWGTKPLTQVMAPAIALAENGFPVSETLATVLQREKTNMGKWPATTAIFWRNGEPLKAGDLLVQKDLAQSLRLIAAEGSGAFYRGEIARKIAAEMAPYPGAITMADLNNYKLLLREPIRGTYRGYEIVTMPPPSSGGIHLVQMLNMLERWPLAQWGHNSDQTIHHMTEVMKLAYADRSEYLGDPEFVRVPSKGLTSRAYADHLAAGITKKARPASDIKPGKPMPYESDQTTHFSVMDSQGNAVAVTYTLNTNFGSGIVAAGTGILLNNEMDDFAAKPGVANAYGLVGGDANAVQPGKRPLSSMTPTMVLKDGKPFLITGSPGGSRIITTVLQTIVNTIDFRMNPAEAASATRFHHQWTPDELQVEKGLNIDTRTLLVKRGHNVATKASMGRTQTIMAHDGVLRGYSDPRNPDGKTLGY
ncbi:gamma-glutamyltransferase [Paracandidimonas soli]|uniref:Glutathione hydrolase proenzyme n=1 Tax=Paracandidimonas soli TaxID=1917182 RepID=A0A4R3VFY0_9BURK|nr:gamma-glutamyltransferase [Paracandidimonas soli]TCV02692.1 gamma-glutamyltransferase 1 [Paracandidimonas soli]